MLDASGYALRYHGWSLGKNKQAAKAEIEKLKLETLSHRQLVNEAMRILMTVRDPSKEKDVLVEMVWIGEHTEGKSQLVSFNYTVVHGGRKFWG